MSNLDILPRLRLSSVAQIQDAAVHMVEKSKDQVNMKENKSHHRNHNAKECCVNALRANLVHPYPDVVESQSDFDKSLVATIENVDNCPLK